MGAVEFVIWFTVTCVVAAILVGVNLDPRWWDGED